MIKKNAVTIKDVAEKAGVSPSTVSRVISKNPRISKETTDKINVIMDEMGYYPNAIARSLAKNRTGTIGVIMPTTSEEIFLNPFFPEALRGIAKEASKSNYDLLLSTNSEKDEELRVIQNLIRGSKVDGIILMSSKLDDESIDYLVSIEFPFSLIGTPNKHVSQTNHVDNDNYQAAYELTKHLITVGRQKIAMIAGDERLTVTKNRVNGYKNALKESGLKFNKDLVFTGSFDEKTGALYGEIIAALEEKPDAVLATDDLVAFGTLRAFKELGIRVPEDIALASFNNSILAKYSEITLTSVDINSAILGKEAMELVVNAVENGVKGNKVITPYTIYKRRSTENT